jgi:hypothetical protein
MTVNLLGERISRLGDNYYICQILSNGDHRVAARGWAMLYNKE